MQVHLVQHRLESLRPQANRERVSALIAGADIAPRSLVVLPELFSLGALPPDFQVAAHEDSEAEDRAFLTGIARNLGAWVLGSTASRRGEKLTNLAILFDPEGRAVTEYGKLHPFSLGGEDRHFESGEAATIVPLEGFTLQPTICYDLRFPELFRAGLRAGADLMTVQANWPESRREHWEVLLRARAIENQSFVVGVNCVGEQHGTRYFGGSRVVSPKGEVIAEAGTEETVLTAELSPEHVRAWRRVFPALRDRKPDGFWNV